MLKIILVVATNFITLSSFAEGVSDSTFLFFERYVGILKDKQGVAKIDTTFEWSGVIFKSKRRMLFLDEYRKAKQVNINFSGRLVSLINDEKKQFGLMVQDSILKKTICCNRDIQFILVPIKKGIQLPFINGQLVRGTTQIMKIIRDGLDPKGLQFNCHVNERMRPCVFCGHTWYSNRKECEIFNVSSMRTVFQAVKKLSDSTYVVNSYFSVLRRGYLVSEQFQFTIKPFPRKSQIDKIRDDLLANWSAVKGTFNNYSSGQSDSLKNIHVGFSFANDQLIISRKFLDGKARDASDTLTYSVNPTGDYLVFKDHQPSSRPEPNIILKKVTDRQAIFIIDDYWDVKNKRELVRLFLEMRKD